MLLNTPESEAELASLITILVNTERRLAALTDGQVDSVLDGDGRAFLLSRVQEQMRAHEALKHAAILDALEANIALVDSDGVIVSVNAAWKRFANMGNRAGLGVGVNYLAVCEAASGEDAAVSRSAGAGIRAVLDGSKEQFSLEYPCHSPIQQHWFFMTVSPVAEARWHGAIIMHMETTARKLAENQSREAERRFSELLRTVELASVMLDCDGQITFCNDYLLRLTGWQYEEVIGKNWFETFLPDNTSSIKGDFALLLANVPEAWHRENEISTRTGERRLVRWSNSVLRSGSGEVVGSASIGEDITEQRRAEISIRNSNRVYAVLSGINTLIVRVRDRDELFRQSCEIATEYGGFKMAMICIVDPQTKNICLAASSGKDSQLLGEVHGLLSHASESQNTIVGWTLRERQIAVINDISNDPRVLLGRKYREAGVRSLAAFPLLAAGNAVGTLVLYAGEVDFFHREELKLLTELAGDIAFAIDHIDKSNRLDYLAFYDALTELPSAHLFKDRLEKFVQAARQEKSNVCVVVLDLERFTQLNDSLGRSIGDELLRAVAVRLAGCLSEPYALGRIGSDTFAIACPSDADIMPSKLRETVVRCFDRAFAVVGKDVHLSAQLGIALYPADGDTSDGVFTNAEAALKVAKTSGVRSSYFSHELNARLALRFAHEEQLRAAIDAEQFLLHYQPRVDMISGELIGGEALIRWQQPERGLVMPAEFIHLAEETGLIVQIGAWVIDAVCAQQAAWVLSGISTVPMAINLSSVQFENSDLVNTVSDALAKHELDAKLLVLELTESAVMSDPVAAAGALHALRRLGVGLALDDFGTGFSSLAHLKSFPFDSIKIDRSFVTDITSNTGDAAIANAIIAMAHGLKLKVVAEGVETQGQFNHLRAHACDEMQGFLFGPAVPSTEFEAQLRASKRLNLPSPAPGDERTLLIVDDEQGIRAALTRMLRRDGYRILHASSGQEGLDLLALNHVQVIISDQRMPGMTGTEFLSTVSQFYPNTVRIILSGYTDLSVVTDAVNRGSVFKFLTKPWDDDQLREQVRDAFRRYVPKASM